MRVKKQHIHLAAATLFAAGAIFMTFNGTFVAAGFLGIGAVVAAVNWKAAKTGLLD